jgi:hypothetical protein
MFGIRLVSTLTISDNEQLARCSIWKYSGVNSNMPLQHARESTALLCRWSAEVESASHIRGTIQVLP